MELEHAKPGEVVDLRPLGDDLASARTSALVKLDRFEAMRLVVRAGTTIPSHEVPGYITLHCLEGEVILEPSAVKLCGGDWVFLDRGAPHSIRGIEDSSLLLTIYFDE